MERPGGGPRQRWPSRLLLTATTFLRSRLQPSPPPHPGSEALPPTLLGRLLEILERPEGERDAALAELRRRHPEHGVELDRCLQAAAGGQPFDRLMAAFGSLPGPVCSGTRNESLPASIGPYRVLGVLGAGGMGIVYLAERTEPRWRFVAVKVVKFADSAAVLRRFELERRALAVMRHPAIAEVFDAGTTDGGLPYFAMEFVPGRPLTEYCDEHRLSLSERIVLFQQVCAGVEHAHDRGVIHRDLKPSNILVITGQDGPAPKLIDFGLARATGTMLQQTALTSLGEVMGTLEYMSPEQADPNVTAIDARTDVYSLGVVLYELLVGTQPRSPQELRRLGMEKMLAAIRDAQPARPSARLRSFGRALARETARTRRTSARSLSRALVAALDRVVLKAMAKGPAERYQSAAELARELQRYLDRRALTPVLGGDRQRLLLAAAPMLLGFVVVIASRVAAPAAVTGSEQAAAARTERHEPGIDRATGRVAGDGRPASGAAPTADATLARGSGAPTVPAPSRPQPPVTESRQEQRETEPSTARVSEDPPQELPSGWDALDEFGTDADGRALRIRHRRSGMEMVLVPAGEATVGRTPWDPDAGEHEWPPATVVTRVPFYAGVHEVTRGQFRRLCAATGSAMPGQHRLPHDGENHPVAWVTRDEARTFAAWLGARLPSEEEWEYVARAGAASRFFTGDAAASLEGFANVGDPAVSGSVRRPFPFDDGFDSTAPVGSFRPNAWGIHDALGNVAERCAEEDGRPPVARGGSWAEGVEGCRLSARRELGADGRWGDVGFRCVLSLVEK